jgi:electron transfer flavoprotein alpha subunit
MSILCLIQSSQGQIPKSSLAAVQAADALKKSYGLSRVVGLVVGSEETAQKAAVAGLDELVFIDDSSLQQYFFESYAALIADLMQQGGHTVFVTTSSSLGKDLAPVVAQKLSAGQASDIIQVNSDGTLRRPMYAGDILADVSIESEKKVITVRASSFTETPAAAGVAVKKADVTLPPSQYGSVEKLDIVKAERPELGDARIVVSGGRALQSAENFQSYMFPLADAFGAAIGASRAAVDSGYAPNDWQVGQTGKIVAPELYVAVGISGAIQHLAGMKDSKKVVAINKDAEAPIFEITDYGLVADLYTAVPELTQKVLDAKK